MARAEAATPSIAKHLPFSGATSPRRPAVSGHAGLLAHPAYRKLLAAEPLLRRAIPVLIVIFLIIVGLARFVELYAQKTDREQIARDTVAMTASVIASAFAKAGTDHPLSHDDILNILADALPQNATIDGRRIFISDGNATCAIKR